ncbi:MAG TPA: glycosyltransferase [Gemmatimonadaceae bacterium]|nr:glycosyltransferase [Gemmatimonadaceae bacterium]
MRILFYIEAREWTGSARAFLAAARGLEARGHQIVFACDPESAVAEHARSGTCEVVSIRPEASLMGAALRVRAMLARFAIDVVFVPSDREQVIAATGAWLADRAAVVRRLPIGAPFALSRRGRFALRLATTGFAFSSEDDVRAAPRLAHARLEPAVLPLGVDVQQYEAVRGAARAVAGVDIDADLIVCIGDAESRVPIGTVLRVVAMLAPRHPRLRLAVLGRGTDTQDLRLHAAALRITRLIRFLGDGSGSPGEAMAMLGAADLGWIAAGGDDGAFAALDLLASRVPVLAERGTIARHFVPDGIAGVLLPPADPPSAAAVVARLLALGDERIAMGNAGHARVARDFSEVAMIEAFERAAIAAGSRA